MGAGWPLGKCFPLSKGEECFMAPQILSRCPVQLKEAQIKVEMGKNGSTRALQLQLWRASSFGQTQSFAKGNKVNFLTSNGRPKQGFLMSETGIPDLQ